MTTIVTQRPTALEFHDGDGDLIARAEWNEPITPRTPGFWEVSLVAPMGYGVPIPPYTVHGGQEGQALNLTGIVGRLWDQYRVAWAAYVEAQKLAQETVARANGFDLAEGEEPSVTVSTIGGQSATWEDAALSTGKPRAFPGGAL